jgi:oligopeptide transport system substrate-binding protein
VATRWQSNDNRIWTFTLRDNAKWSDGTPSPRRILSTAGSVWLTRKPPLRLPGLRRWQASTAQAIIDGKAAPDTLGVTAVDARTLRVQLDKPLPWFSNLTANFAFYPVQKANVESGKEWTRPGALVGNGAYV